MPTVSVDFEGNESDLVSAFDKVGASSKNMSDAVDSSGEKLRESGEAFNVMEEGADTAERRFTGFYDTIGGTRDALTALSDESLSTSDKLIALGQAGADLAGGLADFVIPMVRSLWTRLMETAAAQAVMTAAQTAWNAVTTAGAAVMNLLNTAMRANPILFVVGLVAALVGAFILLWNKSEGFRNFFIGMWNGIKSVVGGVIGWIVGAWNGMLTFFSNLVTGIGNIFSGIGNAIRNAFKGAVNFVIDMLNGVIGFFNKIIYGINLINPFDDIPPIPKIPRMHSGGVVPGSPGQEVLAVLQAGERVSMSGQGGGNGGAVEIRVGPGADKGVAELINYLVRKGYITAVGT